MQTQYGIEIISNSGAKLWWDLLPGKIKNSSSLSIFKNEIRKQILKKYLCELCQTYVKISVRYI